MIPNLGVCITKLMRWPVTIGNSPLTTIKWTEVSNKFQYSFQSTQKNSTKSNTKSTNRSHRFVREKRWPDWVCTYTFITRLRHNTSNWCKTKQTVVTWIRLLTNNVIYTARYHNALIQGAYTRVSSPNSKSVTVYFV